MPAPFGLVTVAARVTGCPTVAGLAEDMSLIAVASSCAGSPSASEVRTPPLDEKAELPLWPRPRRRSKPSGECRGGKGQHSSAPSITPAPDTGVCGRPVDGGSHISDRGCAESGPMAVKVTVWPSFEGLAGCASGRLVVDSSAGVLIVCVKVVEELPWNFPVGGRPR